MKHIGRWFDGGSIYLFDNKEVDPWPWADACRRAGDVVSERVSDSVRASNTAVLVLAGPPEWTRDALCVEPQYEKLNFFAQGRRQAAAALAVCAGCLVRAECLADAEATEALATIFGIRGGLSAGERRRRKMAELAVRPAPENDRVYFATRADGLIKIGHSTDIPQRMAALKIQLITSIPGGRELEQELHKRFAYCAAGREWFDPSPELLRYIDFATEQVAS